MPDREEVFGFVESLWPDSPNSDNELKLKEYLDDMFRASEDTTDWKQKYEELDSSWRKRYADRFNGKQEASVIENDLIAEEEPEIKKRSYDDLFELKGV